MAERYGGLHGALKANGFSWGMVTCCHGKLRETIQNATSNMASGAQVCQHRNMAKRLRDLKQEVARREGIASSALERESLKAYLERRRHQIAAEEQAILARHRMKSADALYRAIKSGRVKESPAWEDYIELKELTKRRKAVERDLRSLREPG